MAADRVRGQNIGRITSGISPHALELGTISFVRRSLPGWRDDPNRPYRQSENELNLQLCKYLDSLARIEFAMVCFTHEEYQSGRHSVDLSASPARTMIIGAKLYAIYNPITVFECKRLPTPGSGREREYVTGQENRNGGIQRFKLGFHGAEFPVAAMIGYLENHNPLYWHQEINTWISELANGSMPDVCTWHVHEKLKGLEEDASKGIASCGSVHDRPDSLSKSAIELYHLWVVMNIGQPSSANNLGAHRN